MTRLRERSKTLVAFANTNFLNLARRAGNARELSAAFVIFNDGIGLDLASALVCGTRFPDNLNGTDLTAALLDAVPAGTRVFLFGARPDVVQRAAERLTRTSGVEVCGFRDGYRWEGEVTRLIEEINAARPDIVLVALGNPRQEQWIVQHQSKVEAPLLMAVGAFLDFVAGAVPRAPKWVQGMRLEWCYRLMHEPGRLWRRYTIDIGSLFLALLTSQFSGQSGKR